jgi:hypothetical protein
MFVRRLRGDGVSASLPDWSAGGWPYPRAPPERRASPRVLRGSSLSGTLGQQAACQRDPRACPLLRRRQFRAVQESCADRTAHHLAVGRRTGLQPARTPLLGLSKDRPSIDLSAARPLSAEGPRKRVFPTPGPGLPPPGLVPSLPFLPTSTVFSAQCRAGLLHPAADHGVRHVSGSLTVSSPCATDALPTRCRHRVLARPAATPALQDESWFARAARHSHPRQGVCAARPTRSAWSSLWCRHRCVLLARRADVLQLSTGKPASHIRTGNVSRRVAFLVTLCPSESFPRRQPYRVTAAPCPLAVQPPRSDTRSALPLVFGRRWDAVGLKALLHRRVRCSTLAIPCPPHSVAAAPCAGSSKRFTRYSLGLASLSGCCLVDLPTGFRGPGAADAATPIYGRRCRRVAERLRRHLGRAGGRTRALAAGPRQPPQIRRTGCGARDETQREVAVGCRLPCDQPPALEVSFPSHRRRSCSAWFTRSLCRGRSASQPAREPADCAATEPTVPPR